MKIQATRVEDVLIDNYDPAVTDYNSIATNDGAISLDQDDLQDVLNDDGVPSNDSVDNLQDVLNDDGVVDTTFASLKELDASVRELLATNGDIMKAVEIPLQSAMDCFNKIKNQLPSLDSRQVMKLGQSIKDCLNDLMTLKDSLNE